jgi:glycosyltransferase involved in cell wall biosynthesis
MPLHQRRIAVDLTPVLPGGANGGAKPYALTLIHHLCRARRETEFVLLTAARSHDELANLDADNVRRLCVMQDPPPSSGVAFDRPSVRARSWIKQSLARMLPPPALGRAASAYHAVRDRPRESRVLLELGADLLFCPFTAPLFRHARVPLVSFIHDLQYLLYPQFFTAEQRHYRARDFGNAARYADRLVCMSSFVRQSIVDTGRAPADRVVSISSRLIRPLDRPPRDVTSRVLAQLDLSADGFLLYPANGWPNKNHQMLLTAFGLFKARNPKTHLSLVCTGVLEPNSETLRQATRRMGLANHIRLPGYLSEYELAALFDACAAVIFPSLYEGFGLPLVEAMHFGKPLLCSNTTSLPEVAGSAALYFDPRLPGAIAAAIEVAATGSPRLTELAQASRKRLDDLPSASYAVDRYLQIFDALIAPCRP